MLLNIIASKKRWRRTQPAAQFYELNLGVLYHGVDGMQFQTIPIMRIFDEDKAKEFYLGFLGMALDWGHRFEDGYPIYMQVSLGDLVLHLSEHSGDCTPGSKVFVNVSDLDKLFAQITAKLYKYNKPSIEDAPWGARCFTVTDPFSNRILFNESADI